MTLLQAFETARPASPSWSDEDRAWATRLALEGDAHGFVARRARHAMQRLAPREGAVANWLVRRSWRWRWIGAAVVAGIVLGVLADSIGAGQRINLLAPPLWGVLLWNGVVYLLLLGHALARTLTGLPSYFALRHLPLGRPGGLVPPARPGALVRLTQRVLRIGHSLPGLGSVSASASGSAPALQSFASLWLARSAQLSAARAAALLHACAAALALGLVAGLYLRGLVLDYRASWESTFLSAETAHAALAFVLGPAAQLAGIALPDAVAFEAMRAAHDSAAAGAPAAPWIHLLALTLVLAVVLPRTLLAFGSALRSHWLAGHVALPLADPYFERLARQQQGDIARVHVVPYASAPGVNAARWLQGALAAALGDGAQLEVAATLAFGAEDDAAVSAALPPGTTLALALFDSTATPEADNHGRFARQLAARVTTIVVIDEAAFRERFGMGSDRLAQRRDAWRVFAESLGTLPVFIDLAGAGDGGVARAVQLAMRNPVRATP